LIPIHSLYYLQLCFFSTLACSPTHHAKEYYLGMIRKCSCLLLPYFFPLFEKNTQKVEGGHNNSVVLFVIIGKKKLCGQMTRDMHTNTHAYTHTHMHTHAHTLEHNVHFEIWTPKGANKEPFSILRPFLLLFWNLSWKNLVGWSYSSMNTITKPTIGFKEDYTIEKKIFLVKILNQIHVGK
jgi:hypothetical protein